MSLVCQPSSVAVEAIAEEVDSVLTLAQKRYDCAELCYGLYTLRMHV